MRKVWILVFVLGLLGATFYFVTNYLFYGFSPNNIIPAIRLPGKDIRKYMPISNQTNFPIRVTKSFSLDNFADMGGDLPRVMTFDSNGTLLVSSTKSGKVFALPDVNRDYKADEKIVVLSGLNKPHGIAFDGDTLYIAETDKVSSFVYNPDMHSASGQKILFDLPPGGRHFTRTIKIYNNKLYTSVGSSCDVCVESDFRRAAILVSNLDGSDLSVFAKGLRNTVFFTFDKSGKMWGTDMGRDGLGDDLPPDELNIIEEGKDYGWPYCYGNRVRDREFKDGEQTSYCNTTVSSAFNFQAHVAPLGMAFIKSEQFTPSEQGNLLVSFHGSWNRSTPVGYSVSKLSLFADSVTNVEEYLTGWFKNSEVFGRPVDLIFDDKGSLFITDDHAGLVYIYRRY